MGTSGAGGIDTSAGKAVSGMHAFVVTPRVPRSGRVQDIPPPVRRPDQAMVDVLWVGVDGTDRELTLGEYGEAPPGDGYLVTGHESLGRVREAPEGTLSPGSLVVAIVRRPDPEPCMNCAAGEWDMCLNGRYTERGIKGAHGFLCEQYVEDPKYLVQIPDELERVAVLLEPLSIVEKAMEQIKRVEQRLTWRPQRAMVMGAGSVGTLAALLLRLDGLEVILYSQGAGGRGREIGEADGVTYIDSDQLSLGTESAKGIGELDIVIEATGYSPLAFTAMEVVGPNGVVCLTGVSGGSRKLEVDASHLNLQMVLENKLVFGTVNANRRHFESGVAHMRAVEGRWPGLLGRMIHRRIPLAQLTPDDLLQPGELKTVVEIS